MEKTLPNHKKIVFLQNEIIMPDFCDTADGLSAHRHRTSHQREQGRRGDFRRNGGLGVVYLLRNGLRDGCPPEGICRFSGQRRTDKPRREAVYRAKYLPEARRTGIGNRDFPLGDDDDCRNPQQQRLFRLHSPTAQDAQQPKNALDAVGHHVSVLGQPRQPFHNGDDARRDAHADSKPSAADSLRFGDCDSGELRRCADGHRRPCGTGALEYGGSDGDGFLDANVATVSGGVDWADVVDWTTTA